MPAVLTDVIVVYYAIAAVIPLEANVYSAWIVLRLNRSTGTLVIHAAYRVSTRTSRDGTKVTKERPTGKLTWPTMTYSNCVQS